MNYGDLGFNRTPVQFVPELDDDTSDPVYSLNWDACQCAAELDGVRCWKLADHTGPHVSRDFVAWYSQGEEPDPTPDLEIDDATGRDR